MTHQKASDIVVHRPSDPLPPRELATRSVVLDAGRLWILSPHRLSRIEPWPDLTAWTWRCGRWVAHRPVTDLRTLLELRLLADVGTTLPRTLEPWVGLLRAIPGEVVQRLVRYPSGHWFLLRMVGRCPSSFDLLDNPGLAFSVAHASRLGYSLERRGNRSSAPFRDPLEALVSLRRREVVGNLGFPMGEATVRTLKRVPIEHMSLPLLRTLRRALCESTDTEQLLSPLRQITPEVVHIVGRAALRRLVTSGLLAELQSAPQRGEVHELLGFLEDVADMRQVLTDSGVALEDLRGGLLDLRALGLAHETLALQMGCVAEAQRSGDLPAPPFPGDEHLIPLRAEQELVDEGVSQRNCVGSYGGRVRRREAYVYALLRPERATVSLVRRAGQWHIGELKRAANRKVAPETWTAVREWFARVNTRERDDAAPASSLLSLARRFDAAADASGSRRTYVIRSPQLATLVLRFRSGCWTVAGLTALDGGRIRAETRMAIERWLLVLRTEERARRGLPRQLRYRDK